MVTTLDRGSGTASAAGAEASENVVAAVLTASVGVGREGVRRRGLDPAECTELFGCLPIKLGGRGDRRVHGARKVGEQPGVRATSSVRGFPVGRVAAHRILRFGFLLPRQRMSAQSVVVARGGWGFFSTRRFLDAGFAGIASSGIACAVIPGGPAAERDVDFLSDESTSVPADEAARFRAELLRDQDSFFDEDLSVCENLFIDGESPVGDVPDESAYAVPGVVAMATPTPRVTARAPTRPMCLA